METWLKSSDVFQLQGYNVFRQDRLNDQGHGGVLIAVHREIQCLHMVNHDFPNVELTGVQIKDHKEVINIWAWYCPRFNPDKHKFENFLNNNKERTLLIGDFNSHHSLWGSGFNNFNGNLLANYITNSTFCNLNNKMQPTFQRNTYFAILDLVFASSDITNHIKTYITKINYNSDHFPGIICYNKNLQKKDNKSINYNIYNKLVRNTKPNCNNNDIRHTTLNPISKIINRCKTSINNKTNNHPWWNQACQTAVRKVYKLRKILNYHVNSINYDNYLKANAEMKKTINKNKRAYWYKLLSDLSSKHNTKKLWNLCNNLSNNQRNFSPCKVPMIDFITFAQQSHNKTNYNNLNNIVNMINNTTYEKTPSITKKDLYHTLKSSKITSPGIDRINYTSILHLTDNWIDHILKTYNTSLDTGVIPKSFQNDIQCPIHKPNTPLDSVYSFRPITLINCVAKIMEKIIANRISWNLEKQFKFAKFQFGFRPGIGTSDALKYFSNSITNLCKNNHNYTHCITFDLVKAFESVPIDALYHKMKNLQINDIYTRWIINYLHNRQCRIKSNGKMSDAFTRPTEIIQGGPSSAHLFNIFCIDLGTLLDSKNINYVLFADDLIIWHANKDNNIAHRNIQKQVIIINEWFSLNDLCINTTKTKHIIFTHKKNRNNINMNICINNQPIENVNEIRYLGIIFNANFNHTNEINRLKNKLINRSNLIKRLANNNNGLKINPLIMIYRNLCRSLFLYGSEFYATWPTSYKNKLSILINSNLRIITGALRSTPTNALYILCNDLPLKLFLLKYVGKRTLHILENKNHPLHSWQRHQSNNQIPDSNMDYIYSQIKSFYMDNMGNRFIASRQKTSTLPENDYIVSNQTTINLNNHLSNKTDQYIHHISDCNINDLKLKQFQIIYTDGSYFADSGYTGAAAVNIENNIAYYSLLKIHSGIYLAELEAILKALLLTIEKGWNKVAIMCDNKAVLHSINNHNLKFLLNNPDICEIHRYLTFLFTNRPNFEISFNWIPSHKNILGNDLADTLAKSGILTNFNVIIKPPACNPSIIPNWNNHITTIWNTEWNDSTINNYNLKIILPNYKFHPKWTTLSRTDQIMICRLTTGTCITRPYLNKINNDINTNCPTCNIPETLNHIYNDCPKFQTNHNNLRIICNNNNIPHYQYPHLIAECINSYKNMNKLISEIGKVYNKHQNNLPNNYNNE
jgi:ribonuclease HI